MPEPKKQYIPLILKHKGHLIRIVFWLLLRKCSTENLLLRSAKHKTQIKCETKREVRMKNENGPLCRLIAP